MKKLHVRRGAHWMVMSLFAIAGCGGDSGTNNGGGGGGGGGGGTTVATTAVNVDDNVFTPPDIVVAPGATVTWVGSVGHNVTFASATVSAPSATQSSGNFQVMMPTAVGTYDYQCTIHGGMDGSVLVQ